MPAPHRFVLCAAGCTIRLEANSQEAFDLLDRYIFPSIQRLQPTSGPHDLSLRLEEDNGVTRLFLNDAEAASAPRPHNLLRKAIDCLDTALVPRLNGLHAVHAGAVLLYGRALLFPGSSHSGKSSLVHEFHRRGVVCFSDEYALIDPEGRVHAYPRVLLVRDEAGNQSPVLQASVPQEPAPVGWILTLQYQHAGAWAIDPVPQSVALLTLLQNTPHALKERPDMIHSFQRAADSAACYAGRRGEAADAVDRILEMTRIDR